MDDVCVVFTQFYCENRFRTPPWCASFSVPLFRLWDEKCFFRVPAIACPKLSFVDRYYEKSMFRKNDNFQETTSFEPVQSRTTFRLHFDPPNGVEKLPAAAQARVKLLLDILHFFRNIDFSLYLSTKIDFWSEIVSTPKT